MRAVSAVAPCCVCRTQPKSERPPLAFVPDARSPPIVFSISLAGVKINLPFRAAMRTRLLLIACFVAGLCLTSPHPVPPVPFIIATALASVVALNSVAGVLFGYLYWHWGIETAISAHFAGDMVVQTLG